MTCTGDYYADVAVHAPGGLLKGKSLGIFVKMTRVLRQSVVIDSRLLTIRLRSEEDECRFYTRNAWHYQAHISQVNTNLVYLAII